MDFATVRVRNVIGELSDFLESHPGEREDLARPPPQVGSREAGGGDQEAGQGEPEHEKKKQAEEKEAQPSEKAGEAENSIPGSAGDRHPGGVAVKQEEDEEESAEKQSKDSTAKSKAIREEVSEAKHRPEEVEVATEPEASGEGDEENKESHGVREVVPESPHRRRRRRKRSEASRTRSPKVRRRGESSHRRRRRAASKSEKRVPRPTHAPEGRVEHREVRRPRFASNPPPGFTGQTILVPARPVYRGPPDSPEYRPYEGAKNKGKKKVETQRYFKDYVAERRAEKRKAREEREGHW